MQTGLKPIRLLHLEDSELDAQLISDILENDGFACDIVRARDAAEFDAALLSAPFDLILCDYNLPGFDGVSALQHAREKRPGTPVIIVSGSMGEEEAVKCLQVGATDYLLKDRLERFVPAVKRALLESEEQRKRLQSEMELRESEERFRQLAQHSADVFWFSSVAPERILYVTSAVEKIWGLTAEDCYADFQAPWKAVHPEDRARVQVSWKACARGEAARFEEEYRIVQPDGKVRWVQDSRTGIRDAAGKIVRISGMTRDITDRKQTELQVLRAQRLESLGTLAGGVAHDLNNALAPILMATELLRMQMKKKDMGTTHLDIIEVAAHRGADMVRQLLTFAKGTDGQRLLLRSERLLTEIEKMIRGTFPKNIELRTAYSTKLCNIIGDPTQLHQVLLNLCVNARDAMPTGGVLTLKADTIDIDEAYAATVPNAKPGSYVMWRVEDSGSGIPPEVLERIFEPFFTTKGPEKGTGLGLSTVLGIVESHGGFIRVYSVPQQGTTFAVYLPVAATPENDTHTITRQQIEFRGNGETVLVVDDEAAVRDVVQTVLTGLNLNVLSASDGTEALVRVADTRAPIRAVITDLHMPGMDGLGFVKLLKCALPGAGVIVVSGRLDEGAQSQFRELGVNAFLDKPFTQDKLLSALKKVLLKG